MTFASPLDELQHWLGQLAVDLRLGADRRHVLCNARLCWVLIEQLERNPGDMDQATYTRLSLRLLDLQREIDPPKRAIRRPAAAAVYATTTPSTTGPRLRLVRALSREEPSR